MVVFAWAVANRCGRPLPVLVKGSQEGIAYRRLEVQCIVPNCGLDKARQKAGVIEDCMSAMQRKGHSLNCSGVTCHRSQLLPPENTSLIGSKSGM